MSAVLYRKAICKPCPILDKPLVTCFLCAYKYVYSLTPTHHNPLLPILERGTCPYLVKAPPSIASHDRLDAINQTSVPVTSATPIIHCKHKNQIVHVGFGYCRRCKSTNYLVISSDVTRSLHFLSIVTYSFFDPCFLRDETAKNEANVRVSLCTLSILVPATRWKSSHFSRTFAKHLIACAKVSPDSTAAGT